VLPLPLVLATQNADKAREIVEIFVEVSGVPLAAYALDGVAFVVDRPDMIGAAVAALPAVSEPPDVTETGPTLEANAHIKAKAVSDAFGALAIADDTGLEVDALGGSPGVRSARFAGDDATDADNVALLLDRVAGVPTEKRTARFATVALAAAPDGREVAVRGVVEGHLAAAPRGDGGFGYDPLFVPVEGDGRTFAEMAPAEKHAISHRGRAFRALASVLDGEGAM
jgi:XTP/dITP diphosphohydrolase